MTATATASLPLEKNRMKLPSILLVLRLVILTALFAAFGLKSASAFSYPAVNGTNFLYGNSAVNQVGQNAFFFGPGVPYRYFIPHNYNSATRYPVVVFLHGLGEGGTDNNKQLTAGSNTANGALALLSSSNPNNQDTYPCFMVFPQSGSGWWGATSIIPIQAILSTLNQYYSIDTSRISLTGLSAGGIGTWNIMQWQGGNANVNGAIQFVTGANSIFSCGVPLSASADNSIQMPKVPMWAFHAANDPTVGVGGDDIAIANMRNHGYPAIYTRYATGSHSTAVWGGAYQTPLLLPWMLAQKLGEPMHGVFNIQITNSSQSGSSLNLSGLANSSPTYTAMGWTSNFQSTFQSGTGTAPTWSISSIPLSFGYNLVQVIGQAPSYNTNNGGLTTASAPFSTIYNNQSNASTPSIGITSPVITNSSYAISSLLALSGTAASSGGTITQVTWTTSLGYSGTASGTTNWSVANVPLIAGLNTVTVIATDANANTSSVSFDVTYGGASANHAPVVYAYYPIDLNVWVNGPYTNPYVSYQTITWSGSSANAVNLQGSVTDDGLPNGSSVTYGWTQVGGPSGNVIFSNPSSLATTATFTQIGTYVMRLTASDGALSSSSDVTVTVLPTGTVQAAIDCGSTSSFTSTDSISYIADNSSTGTNLYDNIGPWTGLGPDPNGSLYQTMRVANSGTGLVYSITKNDGSALPNGTYDVDLKFIEPSGILLSGARVFNISAQGQPAVSNLDIYDRIKDLGVNNNRPASYDHIIPGVTVTNGTLNITLSGVVGYPVISGIVVRTSTQAPTASAATILNGPATATGRVGIAYNFTYQVGGYPQPTFSVTSGQIPTGVLLSSAGVLAGTPLTAGTYTGTITAANALGSANQNFSIVVAPSTAPTEIFNFAYDAHTLGNWNSLFGNNAWIAGTVNIANAKDFNTGLTTNIGLSVTGSFTYGQNYGVSSSALYPSPIQVYAFATTGTASVTVNGLNTSSTYNVIVFGSGAGLSGTGNFTIGSTTKGLAIGNNTTNTATFNNVSPDGTGKILLTVSKGTMSNYNALSVLSISQVIQPPVITNGPAPSSAAVGVAYSFTYTATQPSGAPAAAFSVSSGALPVGLSLSAAGTISGTPTQTGVYAGTVSAFNGATTQASQNFSITVTTPSYSQWSSLKFTPSQQSDPNFIAPTATPLHDGVSNLLKYALDINPSATMSTTDLAALPVLNTLNGDGATILTLTYRQNPSATGITVNLQTSPDMVNWTTVTPDYVQSAGTDSSTGDPMIQVGVNVTGASKEFIRLNVTQP